MNASEGRAPWDWSVAECMADPDGYVEAARVEMTALQMAGAAANRRRCSEAAARTVPEARRALRSLELYSPSCDPASRRMHTEYRAVLLMRLALPEATLAELARQMDTTKDAYAAQLRRALRYSRQLEAAQ